MILFAVTFRLGFIRFIVYLMVENTRLHVQTIEISNLFTHFLHVYTQTAQMRQDHNMKGAHRYDQDEYWTRAIFQITIVII